MPRSRSSRNRDLAGILVGVALLGIVVFYGRQWQPQLTDWLQPWLAKLTGVSTEVRHVVQQMEQVQNAQVQIEELSAENQRLQQELLTLQPMRDENLRLRQLLALPLPPQYRTVTASVLTRSPDHWFERLYIGAGQAQGLQINQVVLSAHGVVGKIREVTQQTALVELISDPASAVACVTEQKRSPAVMEGLHQESARLKYLQNYAQVKPGEKILTSGLGGVFPPGLVLGKVERVEQAASHPVPEVFIQLTGLNQALEEVLVLVPQE